LLITEKLVLIIKMLKVIVEKYKKCNKNNPLTPILKDEGWGMMKNFILHP